jgi:predicted permease
MAIATLALGIGINTVVFTVYDSVAFRQLGVRAPGEIERLQWSRESYPDDRFTWAEYQRLAASGSPFASVVASSDPQSVLFEGEMAHARFVSDNYFDALGVGRSLRKGGLVVSESFRKRKPQFDAGAVGAGNTSLTILGVAPASFEGTGEPAQVPDIWIAASDQTAVLPGVDWIHDKSARAWQVLARRAPGVTHRQSEAALAVLAASWPLEQGKAVKLASLPATFFQTDSGEFQGFALICAILLLAVMLILTMGCINLINLIVARNADRGHEIALRLALGASRYRLLRQLCSESLLLGIGGGLAGWVLSSWSCAWLTTKAALLYGELTGASTLALHFSPDWRTFAWSAALSILTGVAVGLGPALRASKRDVSGALRQSGASAGLEVRRRRNLLVAAQVASCLVLLTAAGLLFRGAARSPETSTGFDVQHAMLASIDATALAGTPTARSAIVSRSIDRVKAVPGIQAVAWADRAPFLGHGIHPFTNEAGARLTCVFNGVSDSYFSALGIPLLSGRNFTRDEIDRGAAVAIVSESTARRLWPGANPLGRRIADSRSYAVIGVVKSVRSTFLSKDDEGFVYFPKPLPDRYAVLLIRIAGKPEQFVRPLRAVLGGAANIVAIGQTPMKVQRWMAGAPALAAGVLGGLALLLASLGIFGVVSRLVALRTREIGIRIALGATRTDVASIVSRQTLMPVAWGAGIGLLGAIGVSSLLQALIVMPDIPDLTYGAGAFDPVTFAGVLFILAATVALAGLMPMRRAIQVEPAVALRDE